MNKYRKLFLTLAAVGVTFGTNAIASDKALIEKLVSKGYLTQDEASELKNVVVAPKSKKAKSLTLSGRLHFQMDNLNGENNGTDIADANHFYFRRLRFGTKVNFENGFYGEMNLGFARNGNTPTPDYGVIIDKAYVGWKYSDAADFKFGQYKVPFGLEETTSSSKIKAVERSAVNRFFADDIDFSARHSGIHFAGECENGFSYNASFVNSSQSEGSRLGGNSNSRNRMAAYGRLQFNTEVQDAKVLLGVDAGFQPDNSVVAADVTAFTGYAQIKMGGLMIQPEAFASTFEYNAAGTPDSDIFGYSVLASYKMGNFEPVVRYNYLDVDTSTTGIDLDELIRRAPAGVDYNASNLNAPIQTELDSFYIGFNYYIMGNDLKLSAGYEYAKSEGPGTESDVDGFRTRLQLLF